MKSDQILLAHGGGGIQSRELVREIFAKRFKNSVLDEMGDSAILSLVNGAPSPYPLPSRERENDRIAFTTDAFVVKPLIFPGGDIGKLAVCGTVNDLAVAGAKPIAISASFIIEEGFEIKILEKIADSMAQTAREAGVCIVAGDTKVVEHGHCDKIFITTSGIGTMITKKSMSPKNISVGDAIIISGNIADHGIAIMTAREGLKLESQIKSDCAPLNELTQALLFAVPDVSFMRDPTRGGLAATLNEAAENMNFGIEINESAIPVNQETMAACEILGIDPLHIANEGKLVAFVPAASADKSLAALRSHPLGREASVIGYVVADHQEKVVLKTSTGSKRIISMPTGEILPRIC